MNKPNAPACERNQQSILDILQTLVTDSDSHLLEIGSGTGQHAVFMSSALPKLDWHTADLQENIAGINMWVNEAVNNNLHSPLYYQAGTTPWPEVNADIVFTANTLHIMSWENALILIKQLGENLKQGARAIIYGPFNYQGNFTSESNERFQQWLKSEGEHRGIRDFEAVVEAMALADMSLLNDFAMPANNRILVFCKQ